MFSKPIPPPPVLAQYNDVAPDAAERIIAMAEREQSHRHLMRSKLIDAQIRDMSQHRLERRLSQIFALVIVSLSIVAGATTAIWGEPVAGGLIGTAGVVALVCLFILDRHNRDNVKNFLPPDDEKFLEDVNENFH
ncbi:MAG: hypothetical protein N5P05_000741 [Chroococcopsis gigantea SAG 12.99]|jgi:uncharacterized membrane protein|nr:DUF2335 domain-containing protein [Chlorogloea purpurea SAG 13.99]MDV2999135.1 hypothetical protein [Chroococcopsis gigantea SAG 12.99]